MAKMTLLRMTQKILSSLNRDEVSSITDTVDSMQVVEIIEDEFNYMLSSRDIPTHYGLIQVQALSDLTKPNYYKLPDNVDNLYNLKYNAVDLNETNPQWKDIEHVHPSVFMERTNYRNLDNSDVIQVVDFGGVPLKIETDKHPDFYTSFDDTYIIMDSYKTEVGATLTAQKTQAFGQVRPTFLMTDDYIPQIEDALFTVLYNEAKATASMVLKQTQDSRAERKSRTAIGRWQHQKTQFKPDPLDNLPNYGRRGKVVYRTRRGAN